MTTTDKTSIVVTIAVNIGGEVRLFEAEASTANNAYDVAQGLLSGLDTEADRWLNKAGFQARKDY